jgi:hypothetical protein
MWFGWPQGYPTHVASRAQRGSITEIAIAIESQCASPRAPPCASPRAPSLPALVCDSPSAASKRWSTRSVHEIAKSSNVSAIGEWKLPGGQNGGLTVNVYGSVAYDVSQKHNASFKFTINRHIRGFYVYKGAPTLRRSFARPVCC